MGIDGLLYHCRYMEFLTHGFAHEKKHRDMGHGYADRHICCYYTVLVHHLSFDISYGVVETRI